MSELFVFLICPVAGLASLQLIPCGPGPVPRNGSIFWSPLQQSSSFKNEIIDKNIPIITIEASCVYSWEKYSNHNMGINTFGESAPYKEVYSHFKLTSANVVEFAKKIIKE